MCRFTSGLSSKSGLRPDRLSPEVHVGLARKFGYSCYPVGLMMRSGTRSQLLCLLSARVERICHCQCISYLATTFALSLRISLLSTLPKSSRTSLAIVCHHHAWSHSSLSWYLPGTYSCHTMRPISPVFQISIVSSRFAAQFNILLSLLIAPDGLALRVGSDPVYVPTLTDRYVCMLQVLVEPLYGCNVVPGNDWMALCPVMILSDVLIDPPPEFRMHNRGVN